MKLFFNIEDQDISSDEIKELLGFVDSNISFVNLLSDFITASKEVRQFIGTDLYDLLHSKFTEGLTEGKYEYDYSEDESNLIRALRYPIAMRAYSLYAPTNDLSHSNDGRRMRNSETEKMAFEWMLDKDEKNQQRRYYRGLDDLIDLLDESKPEGYDSLNDAAKKLTIYYNWISSSSYKSLKGLLLNSLSQFNDVFTIESRYLLMQLKSGIAECERREILPRIGEDRLQLIKASEELENPVLSKIKDLAIEACAFYALAWGIPRKSITMFPEGVLQFQVSDRVTMNAKKPAMLNEHELARQAFSLSATNALLDIESLLKPTPIESTEPNEPFVPMPYNRCADDKGFSIM